MNEIDHIITPNGTRHEIVDAAARELLGSRPTFAGLEIAPGPLFFDGVEFGQYPDWNHNSYNDKYGKVAGSTYFNFIELGKRFDSRGEAFSASSGDIDNARPLDGGWRVPTKTEWEKILATPLPAAQRRPGSILNNGNSIHWTLVSLSDHSAKLGILIFPDGVDGVMADIFFCIDIADEATGIDDETLAEYLENGCVLLPAAGAYWGEYWEDSSYIYQISGSAVESDVAYYFWAGDGDLGIGDDLDMGECYLPVRLVREARSVVESLEEIAGQFYGYETLLNAI